MGRVESGSVRERDSLLVMPNKVVLFIFFLGYCELCLSFHYIIFVANFLVTFLTLQVNIILVFQKTFKFNLSLL